MIMAKKVNKRPNRKKYAGKTEEEWRNWGEKFGKRMDKVGKEMGKKGKEFSKEIEGLAEKFSNYMEKKGKKCKDRWFNVFGPIGPLVKSFFGLAWFMVGVWLLNLVNSSLQSDFILRLTYLITTHLYYFFLAFLFFAYNEYFSKKYQKFFWMISPITNSIGIIIVLWFLTAVINLVTIYVGSNLLTFTLEFLRTNIPGIFLFFVMVGYFVEIVKRSR